MTQSISYSQAQLASNNDFIGRVCSIMKDENFSPTGEPPYVEALNHIHDIAAEPGIAEAYHASVLSEREDGAIADDVITDQMLLSAVTAVFTPAG